MTDEATIRIDGEDVLSVPVLTGTEGERALDISRMRADVGLITHDPGYGNTAETESEVSYVNGEEGILRYRGYPIEQLTEHSTFLEVAYLLYHGELPMKDELERYVEEIRHHTLLREDMRHLFDAFPMDAHPMQILASATTALGTYYPDALDPRDPDAAMISAMRMIAKMPTITAWSYKHRVNQAFVYPRNDLDYTSKLSGVPKENLLALAELYADHVVSVEATGAPLATGRDWPEDWLAHRAPSWFRGRFGRFSSGPPKPTLPQSRGSRCLVTLPVALWGSSSIKRTLFGAL